MFECWNEWMGHTSEDATTIDAFDAKAAAENYCEENFAHWSYPDETEVFVRESGKSDVVKFSVRVESVPRFYATECRALAAGKDGGT